MKLEVPLKEFLEHQVAYTFDMLTEQHQLESGDIMPMQQLMLDIALDNIVEVFTVWLKQNKEE